ncbi:bacterial Ig-like domain-containing protein [Paenibacillus sp. G2S3]|uniref:bacterial Ig-like domain-containing protein n=1 Tax=Paenibacillus sp. G2S3 TaxID=3047872 RepID=UPI0024C10179|nr:bacterial Ig-like domain-containing protein [Paenibacillus sp. G2S3]WHY17220.1 bacterial Ig-like domain-containing protein [Paenibacillus sp. G2S3]
MRKQQRLLAMLVTFLLLVSSFPPFMYAEEVTDPYDGMINIHSEWPWAFSAFGGNTSPVKNPEPVAQDQTSVTMTTYGGKISSSDEGLSFYYKEIPVDANFELTAKATVTSFNSNSSVSTPNQKSFGLMLRDTIGINGDSSTITSNYVAVGALDQVMKGFYKKITQAKLTPFSGFNVPTAGEAYDLSIKKSGNTYLLSIDDQTEIVTLDDTFTDSIFAGLYVARDATVTFSEVNIKVESKTVSSLVADASAMTKTSYLVGESLDLTGLVVKAIFSDHSEAVLSSSDYIVTGFDSSKVGENTVTINYNGASAKIIVQIVPLTMTSLTVKYDPAKTIYYPGDTFDPEGLVLAANYNDGFLTKELTNDLYSLSINGQPVSDKAPYLFGQSGSYEVTITSTEAPAVTTNFNVEVKAATLSSIEIQNEPKQTVYYIGDSIKLEGLVLYAHYSDGTQIRLMKNEYTVSSLDTLTPGDKKITVTHKGLTAFFQVEVKNKKLVGIEVTRYPATTFFLNEDFDSNHLIVSKVYDNSDREVLSSYTLDTSQFDNKKAGVYEISIIPTDSSLKPITYSVTVREKVVPVWHSIQFGQSTSTANNQTILKEDGSVELIALEGGGKVTEDHDGITFYYTELDASEDNFILSADIQVLAFAKTPYDGQESFGMMARDAIGTPGNSSVFASNIAAIGAYSGGTRSDLGTQLFVRSGVEKSDGTGSKGIQTIMLKKERPAPNNTAPVVPYRLTLSKTNSGFKGQLNNGQESIIFTPDILKVQDSKMYVGFYAARLATINISNIQLTVTSAATDSPKVEPPSAPDTPSISILSLNKTSDPAYPMIVRPNVNGTVTLKQGSVIIAQDIEVEANKLLTIPATLANLGDTSFSITFLPDDTQYLTSYDKIVLNFTVTMNSYREDEDIYVSPTGTSAGDGTIDLPLDIDTAIDFVKAGQHIIVLDGRYVRKSPLQIKKYNDGKATAKKYLEAAPGARPVIDFDKKTEGVLLSGNYWHVKGLDITRSAGNTKGFTVGGNYNIVENSRFYANGDTGLQISRTDGTAQEIAGWPSYNLILNSTSFDNRDPSDNNADGFAAKLTAGVGNIFRGCLAHNNIDDGWDLYTKAGSGAIGPVLIENSAAFNNGFLTDGTIGAGDKNGFKLGGEGIHVTHTIRNSIAFGNGAYGFTSNSNPGVIAINNIGFNNARGNMSFTTYDHITADFKIDGFLSYRTNNIGKDQYPSSLATDNNFMYDGTISANKSGKQLSDSNFVSLIPVGTYMRDMEGNVIWGGFLKFIPFEEPEPSPTPSSTSSPSPTTSPTPTSSPSPTASPVPTTSPSPTSPSSSSSSSSSVEDSATTVLLLDGSVRVDIPISMDAGTASAILNESSFQRIITLAKPISTGNTTIRIQLSVDPSTDVKEYQITLPATAFHTGTSTLQLEINSSIATILLPDSIFPANMIDKVKTVTLLLRTVDTVGKIKAKLGESSLIEYALRLDGVKIPLNTLQSAIQIGLPHPAAVPATNNAFIVVWNIDANGNIQPILNGDYDAARKQAIFSTTASFGQYAAVYNHKTFRDISDSHWAKFVVEVLTSKGVINGVAETEFKPDQAITRADFALLLVRILGLTAVDGNGFSDVSPSDYFYEGLMTAQKSGIIRGQTDGRYQPHESISRQEMFVMVARALKAAGKLSSTPSSSTPLVDFTDHNQIAQYAVNDVAVLVAAGLIKGEAQQQLMPTTHSTRAEAAMLIYRILIQK